MIHNILPPDLQIDILLLLSPIDLLNICQTNHYFHSLCQNHPRLNQHFGHLTNLYFGIDRLHGNNWYQTFLTIYNDLNRTANRLINLLPVMESRYLNRNEIRKDLINDLQHGLLYINTNLIYSGLSKEIIYKRLEVGIAQRLILLNDNKFDMRNDLLYYWNDHRNNKIITQIQQTLDKYVKTP